MLGRGRRKKKSKNFQQEVIKVIIDEKIELELFPISLVLATFLLDFSNFSYGCGGRCVLEGCSSRVVLFKRVLIGILLLEKIENYELRILNLKHI